MAFPPPPPPDCPSIHNYQIFRVCCFRFPSPKPPLRRIKQMLGAATVAEVLRCDHAQRSARKRPSTPLPAEQLGLRQPRPQQQLQPLQPQPEPEPEPSGPPAPRGGRAGPLPHHGADWRVSPGAGDPPGWCLFLRRLKNLSSLGYMQSMGAHESMVWIVVWVPDPPLVVVKMVSRFCTANQGVGKCLAFEESQAQRLENLQG